MIREYVGNHIFNVRGNLNGLGSMWLSWRNKLLLVNRYFEVYCFGVIRYSRSKVPGNTKKRTWYQVPIKFLDAIFRYFHHSESFSSSFWLFVHKFRPTSFINSRTAGAVGLETKWTHERPFVHPRKITCDVEYIK